MKDKNKTRLPKAIKIILDVVYGGLLFAVVGLVIWIVITPLLIDRTEMHATASIPVALGENEFSSLDLVFDREPGDAIRSARIAEAKGVLRLETGSSWLIFLSNGSKLVLAIGLAYFFYLLRKIVRSILDGDPFREQNSKLIRRLGYSLLAVGFGSPIVEWLAAQAIIKRLPGTTPALHLAANFDPRIIIGTSLLIFLLSQIWGYGLELERDRALTV